MSVLQSHTSRRGMISATLSRFCTLFLCVAMATVPRHQTSLIWSPTRWACLERKQNKRWGLALNVAHGDRLPFLIVSSESPNRSQRSYCANYLFILILHWNSSKFCVNFVIRFVPISNHNEAEISQFSLLNALLKHFTLSTTFEKIPRSPSSINSCQVDK